MNIKKTDSKQDYAFCIYIRTCVFEVNQAISPLDDFTTAEENAINYIGFDNDMPVATARYQIVDGNIAKVERMAVLKECQGKGCGTQIIKFLIQDVQKNPKIKTIKLGAQKHAIPFYEKLGFTVFGDEYMDVGIPHHDMIMKV